MEAVGRRTPSQRLAGCDTGIFSGPIAVRTNDGGLEIAVCAAVDADEILVLERRSGEWHEFWSASGRFTLEPEDVVRPEGYYAETLFFVEPQLLPGHELDVVFLRGDKNDIGAVLTIPRTGLPTDRWLQSDGAITEETCPDR